MKKLFNLFLITAFLCISFSAFAPPPNPPDNPSSGGGGGGPVGAPIDGGLGILVILAGSAAYGGRKLYKARKENKGEEESA
jgi:hypothetical protein